LWTLDGTPATAGLEIVQTCERLLAGVQAGPTRRGILTERTPLYGARAGLLAYPGGHATSTPAPGPPGHRVPGRRAFPVLPPRRGGRRSRRGGPRRARGGGDEGPDEHGRGDLRRPPLRARRAAALAALDDLRPQGQGACDLLPREPHRRAAQ